MNEKHDDQRITSLGDLERSQQEETIRATLGKIKRKILVMSGKGGVGKSTVAAYIALYLSKNGYRVGLLDVDLHGPSIPHLLNIKGQLDMSENGVPRPYTFSDNLKVLSMQMILNDKDTAIIWRGPIKISAIRQFISDIEWGELEYLIIDSPPGTGDEPLTVAQTIPDSEAVIVTTPQEISVADVKKSITFCRQVNIRILGVIENMSTFKCPHCNKNIKVFGSGGGVKISKQMGVRLLGEIPLDTILMDLGDRGNLERLLGSNDMEVTRAYKRIIDRIR